MSDAALQTALTDDAGRILWRSVLIGGIASIVMGVILLAWPGETLLVLAVIFGIQLIMWGVMFLIGSVLVAEGGGRLVLGVIGGVFAILAGVAAIRAPGRTLVLLALFLGASWLISGILEMVDGITERGDEGWTWTVISGAISAIAGIVVMSFPVGSIATLALWSGILMIVLGAARIWMSLQLRGSIEATATA